MTLPRFSLLLSALGLFSTPFNSHAAEPVFAIQQFIYSGNSKISSDELDQALASQTGEAKVFANIQEAVRSIEAKYADKGYGTVRVVVPEQEITSGKIQLRILEATVGDIVVEGNRHFSTENIRASVPGLQIGTVPNMHDIGDSLRVANENGSKQTTLVFRPAEQPNQVNAALRVTDEPPLKLAAFLDNTGSKSTGNFRTGLIAQHSNFLDRDHIASAQVITSPDHVNKVKIIGLGYRIPLYRQGDSIDMALGYSNVDAGSITTAGGNFGISGSGYLASAKYNFYLARQNDWDHKFAIGLDYRAYKSSVLLNGTGSSLIPNATVHPLTATYSGNWRNEQWSFSGYLTYALNIAGGSDGDTTAFNRPGGRQDAIGHFDVWRYGFTLGKKLPSDWNLRLNFAGQYTNDLLISGEQFRAGGAESVRGFLEQEFADDRGHRVNLELLTPDFGGKFATDVRVQGLMFYDAAQLIRNRPLAGEVRQQNIASAGLGIRISATRNLNLRLDYGIVTDTNGTSRRVGDGRLHGSLLWTF